MSFRSNHGTACAASDCARFCVMTLRNSGQTSRAIYALSRMIFHHNLFVSDSIRISLIHHQTPDSMTSPHYFPESTNRIEFPCSLLISYLSLMHLLSVHRSWTGKVIVHRNYQEDNLSPRMVWGEVWFANNYNQEPRLFLHIFLDVAIC